MSDHREHKVRKDCKVMQGRRVSRAHRDCRAFKVMQDLRVLKGLKVFKDHRVMSDPLELMELTARLCSAEPSIPKQAMVSTETSTSIPRQIRSLAPRRVVPGERVLPLSDPREHKARKVMQDHRALKALKEFKGHRGFQV